MKYNNTFLDTYKKYVSKGWYDSVISSSKLERWTENFDEATSEDSFDPRICAHLLLNSLVFYQDKQIEAIIFSIQNRIRSNLNQSLERLYGHRLSEKDLELEWGKYKQECLIIAGATPDAAADSAYQASRLWRNTTGIETGGVSTLVEQIKNKSKKHIIIVDDLIGTGTKMTNFLSENLYPKKEFYGFQNIRDVMKDYYGLVDFSVAVFALCDSGYNKISKIFPEINFLYADFYNKEYDLTSEQCSLYDLFSENKDNIISYIKKKQQDLDPDNPYALNLPIAFHYGCPNNSLSLYYKSTPKWVRLLPTSHPVKIKEAI